MRDYLMSDRFCPILITSGPRNARITIANDVWVLDDPEELLRGEIEKKRGKKRVDFPILFFLILSCASYSMSYGS